MKETKKELQEKTIGVKDGLQKAGAAVGKAAGKSAEAVKNVAAGFASKVKDENVKAKKRKLNPLFPNEYHSSEFHIPNLIVIVDDAVRRDEELCEGAIGWRNTVKDVEVLYLYDEFVPDSRLSFVPAAVCDSVYYVSPHNRACFFRVDCLFDKTQQEKLAELANIAYCLGAKRYSVQMFEEKSQKASTHFGAKAKLGIGKARIDSSEERQTNSASGSVSKSLANVEFEEAREPVEPKLCWFKNDRYICELIRQRCSGKGAMKSIDIELSGSEYATMSASTSVKVDAAVSKIGLNSNARIEANSAEERSHKMIYHIEF